jgi:alkylation response protein AidB-like acyl-CoA dehydrogenase
VVPEYRAFNSRVVPTGGTTRSLRTLQGIALGDVSSVDKDSTTLLKLLERELPSIQRVIRHPGADDFFPAAIIERLRAWGFLTAPLPRREGGLGWGTEDRDILPFFRALKLLGYASLAVGRIFEAHVNALVLIFHYGDERVRNAAAAAVKDGHLFGLWVTHAADPVRSVEFGSQVHVKGRKAFCTAAGFATFAVITALNEENVDQMLMIDTKRVKFDAASPAALHGMRATCTSPGEFNFAAGTEQYIGQPGDYVREPDFSVGAWRTSAVTVGGLQALIDETVRQLRARARHTSPSQASRIGEMLMKSHSAEAWVTSAAWRSVSDRFEQSHLTGYVNLARVAVELASLDVIALVQRSLGMAAFLTSNPVEAMMRDLMTYLRQPAADEALMEAAIAFSETDMPSSLGDPA